MVRLLLDATTDFVQIARDKLNGMQEGGGELPFAVAFVLIRMVSACLCASRRLRVRSLNLMFLIVLFVFAGCGIHWSCSEHSLSLLS